MSTTFQSCPGCDSFILSDTYECPECGHVFDQERAKTAAAQSEELKSQTMYDTCRKCGESVRSGLVRCWNCNTFMRKDVEARYEQMQATPQKIIFSDIPKEQRTEILQTRDRKKYVSRALDAQDDSEFEFTLRSGDSSASIATGSGTYHETTAASETPAKATVTQPLTEQPKLKSDTAESQPSDAPATPDDAPAAPAANDEKKSEEAGVDDLVGIALQDQREHLRRKKQKVEEARSRRILLPCTRCGAWIRVSQDQSGSTLRCRQCKAPFVVPQIKKKEKPAAGKQSKAAQIKVTWINDVRLHIVSPTDVVLKPASLEKSSETVDAGFHESGLHLVKYAPPAKKSLFGKADGPPDVPDQRKQVREHIATAGTIKDIPVGELFTIPSENVSKVRLIQPVAEAHESMFAGVPVFGEGRIAVYLPLDLPDNKQAFLSFALSEYRKFSDPLKEMFQMELNAEQNGVPATDAYDTLKCNLSDMPIQSLKDVLYYQNDPGYELEVSGYICGTCGIAITEESRARKKLGGAGGKGLAKVKCPACSNKFGERKAYRIVKSPSDSETEEEEDVSEVLRPKKDPTEDNKAPSAADKATLAAADLQGAWKMISIAQNGDFENPSDTSAAGIVFTIDGEKYTVAAGDDVQEQGTLTLNTAESPVQMDQQIGEGPDAGKSHLGIVRIVDGRLQNCQAAFGEARPENFEPQKDSKNTLAIFERA
ncbi:MAG: TIGR03067 domain-containing protein [Planctomycetaceae bacterium]